MQAKIDACLKSINAGIPSVVIASGYKPTMVSQVLEGKRVGTLFVNQNQALTQTQSVPDDGMGIVS